MRTVARSDIGDGDRCPLFPNHGNMLVLNTKGPPKQYCSHVIHDGGGVPDDGGHRPPRTRAVWPLYGLEETVQTYLMRLDHAIAKAELPDLGDLTLEV
jgi:hypothetical protein